MLNLQIGQVLKLKRGGEKIVIDFSKNDKLIALTSSGMNSGFAWYTEQEIKDLFELPKEKWKPKEEEIYFTINVIGEVTKIIYREKDPYNVGRHGFGLCFKTIQEAVSARDKIKALLAE